MKIPDAVTRHANKRGSNPATTTTTPNTNPGTARYSIPNTDPTSHPMHLITPSSLPHATPQVPLPTNPVAYAMHGSDIDLSTSTNRQGSVRMDCDESTESLNLVPGRFNDPFSTVDGKVDRENVANDVVKRTADPLLNYSNRLGNVDPRLPAPTAIATNLDSQPLKPRAQNADAVHSSTITTQPMVTGNVWTNFEQSVPVGLLPNSDVGAVTVGYVPAGDVVESAATHTTRHAERSEEASPMVGVVQQNPVVSH